MPNLDTSSLSLQEHDSHEGEIAVEKLVSQHYFEYIEHLKSEYDKEYLVVLPWDDGLFKSILRAFKRDQLLRPFSHFQILLRPFTI